MKQYNFFLTYALLVLIQMVICNYFHLSAYVLLSILPVMVLCIPIRFSTTAALCIAFVTGRYGFSQYTTLLYHALKRIHRFGVTF